MAGGADARGAPLGDRFGLMVFSPPEPTKLFLATPCSGGWFRAEQWGRNKYWSIWRNIC
jgi:hypothetical protein